MILLPEKNSKIGQNNPKTRRNLNPLTVSKIFLSLLILLFFAIPIEHRYDKLFRIYSLTLIPEGVHLPSFFDKKIFFYLSDFATWILFGWMIVKKCPILKSGGILLSIFLLLGFQSILFSSLSNYPIIYIHFFQYLTPFLLYLFLANGPLEKELLFKAFSWSLFAASCLQSIFALFQYFLQHSLGLRLLNEHPLNATILVPNGRRSLLDFFFENRGGTGEIYRAMGTLSHPNLLGGFLVAGLLLTVVLLWSNPKWRKKISILYFLQLAALSVTYSRSAIFACILGTAFWFFLMRKNTQTNLRTPFLIFFLSLALGSFFFAEQYLHRGGIFNYTIIAAASDTERLSFQKTALKLLTDHPLRGVGFEQFGFRAVPLHPDGLYLMTKGTVHNIYLLIAVEMGIFALGIFLFWIAQLLWNGFKNRATLEVKILLSLFLAFLFIGCCDFYLIFSQQGRLLLFATAGLLARFSRAPSKSQTTIL